MQQKRGGEGSDPVEIPVRALETALAAPSSAPGSICGPPGGPPGVDPYLPHASLPIGGGKSKAWLPTCPPGHWQPITLHSGAPTDSELEEIFLVSNNWCQRRGMPESRAQPATNAEIRCTPPPDCQKRHRFVEHRFVGSSRNANGVFLSNREANQRKKPNYLK